MKPWLAPVARTVLVVLFPCLALAALAPKGYRTAQAYDLGGTGERIVLLVDQRLTEQAMKDAWGITPWAVKAPKAALLQLINRGGEVRSTLPLEGPLARMAWQGKLPAEPVRVSVDFSAGFGSYSGPATRWLTTQGGALAWAKARKEDGTETVVQVAATLKTAWRRRANQDGSLDLFAIACRPTFKTGPQGDEQFLLTYTHYRFNGDSWEHCAMEKPGFWEDEETNFPRFSSFPSFKHHPLRVAPPKG